MTATLTPSQRALVESAAELDGLAYALRLEVEEDGGGPEDFRTVLARSMRRIARRLMETVDEIGGGE